MHRKRYKDLWKEFEVRLRSNLSILVELGFRLRRKCYQIVVCFKKVLILSMVLVVV